MLNSCANGCIGIVLCAEYIKREAPVKKPLPVGVDNRLVISCRGYHGV